MKIEDYRIIYSTISLSEVNLTEQVDKFIVHEEYDNQTNLNDIALIKIHGTFMLGHDGARKIDLNEKIEFERDTILTTYGYGFGSIMNLSMSQSMVFPKNDCLKQYENTTTFKSRYLIEDKQFCIWVTHSGVASGDSGGPVTIRDQNNYPYLAGIVSFGTNHTKPDKLRNHRPGVYTDVRAYYDWIKNTVLNNSMPSENDILREKFQGSYNHSQNDKITYIKTIQINKKIIWDCISYTDKTRKIFLIYVSTILCLIFAHRILKLYSDI